MNHVTYRRAALVAFIVFSVFPAVAWGQNGGSSVELHEQDERNYLSAFAGAEIVASSHPGDDGFVVGNLIDHTAGAEGLWRVRLDPKNPKRPWVIFKLPAEEELNAFAVNTAHLHEGEFRGCTVRQVNFAVSDTTVQSSFKTIARFNLRKRQDNQVMTVALTKAKYLRVMLMGNWNNPEVVEMGRVYAYNDAIISAYNSKLYTEGKVEMQDVFFETGSATLKKSGVAALLQIGSVIKERVGWKFQIEGHTDNEGSAATNKSLSQRRAKAVLEELVRMGVQRSRLKAVGYGSSKPIAANDTPEGRAQNRRVTFRVLRDSTD